MKYLFYTLFLIILCGLWVALAPFLRISGQVPQVLFLLVLAWSLEKQDEDFLLIALLSGLFLDFYSGLAAGSFTVPLLMVALLARLVTNNFLALELNSKYLAALLLPAQVLFEACYFGVGWLWFKLGLAADIPSMHMLLRGFLVALAYNLVFLYPISSLVGWIRYVVQRYIEREYKAR
jgi:cell shape-determining protein MreD